jgi:putative hydrolase of the HAD superfamily
LPVDEANRVRKHYFQTYGTTLRGLMNEHGVKPDEFLEQVHDFDISPVTPCAITQEYLAHLPGRRIVFTNAPQSFADRMLKHLGIDRHFDAVFAIEHGDYWPKPHAPTYETFFKRHAIEPAAACMFEDMDVNLKTAHDLGMTTVWLHGDGEPADHTHVHHRAARLPHWLKDTIKTL